jgi:cytochrome P450
MAAMDAVTGLAGLDIDPETPGLFTRPDYFDVLARLRREAPVYGYAPGAWAISRYDDVRAISRDPERFCSGRGVLMNDPKRDGAELPGSILHLDPPEHGEWRKIASRWFTPRGVSALEDQVRAAATRVLDAVPAGAEIDLVEAIAAPLPVFVIAELLGIGDAAQEDFRRWSDACIEGADESEDGDHELANMQAVGELLGFLTEHTVTRREAPRDDLLSVLVASEVDGRPLGDDEIVMYCLSLLVAGNETSRNLISGGLAALHEAPDQRSHLVAHPDALSTAVEECLRWVTPIQAFARTAVADTEVGGQAVSEGDWLVMLYASANRDEAVFGDDADVFDVTRPPNPTHVAFGFGEHLCLGASLARLETRVLLGELLARFPDYEITGSPDWTRSTLVRGYRALPAVMR